MSPESEWSTLRRKSERLCSRTARARWSRTRCSNTRASSALMRRPSPLDWSSAWWSLHPVSGTRRRLSSTLGTRHRTSALRTFERGDLLHDAACDRLGSEPDPFEDRVALGMGEELLRDPVLTERGVHVFVVQQLQESRAAAPDSPVVLNAHDQPMVTREADHRSVPRL